MSVRIKCCGMFRPEDIVAVNAALPDYCGFVVNFPKSHRSVTPQQCAALKAQLDPAVKAVGVFVDEDPQVVAALVNKGVLHVVQLHGHETADYMQQLRGLCKAPLIKAYKIRNAADVQEANASTADMVLLDNGYGTGEQFDWSQAAGIQRPFMLAGGLTCENLAAAIDALHPWGVDLSSGLELNKVKDAELIARAVSVVRNKEEAYD
ncbi:MAG: phosphoribosylanthranilate isomerase [Coriobacteriia bacterium]|nr:phosphoribosylanthranilate isomerase [Coriobacteriia bacterium]